MVAWRFEKIAGTGYLVAPVYSAQSYSIGLKDKEASAVRNYLFVNVSDKSSRWLIASNDRLILSMERISNDGVIGTLGYAAPPAKWLVFQVVASDTNGGRRLTEADRRLIGVADGDGSHYAEVLRDADAVLGKTWQPGDNLLIVYSAHGKHFVAEIKLADRKVSATKELPKLGP